MREEEEAIPRIERKGNEEIIFEIEN